MSNRALPSSLNNLSPAGQAKAKKLIERVRAGRGASLPLICYGDACPFSPTCPLAIEKQAPEGEDCPFEDDFIEEWMEEKYNNPELSLDKDNYVDRLYASELTQLEVLEWRVTTLLRLPENAGLMVLDVKDVDVNTGEPLCYEKKEHPLLNTLERIHIKRAKIMRDLLATRFDQAKVLNLNRGPLTASLPVRLSDSQQRLRKINIKELPIIEATPIKEE